MLSNGWFCSVHKEQSHTVQHSGLYKSILHLEKSHTVQHSELYKSILHEEHTVQHSGSY